MSAEPTSELPPTLRYTPDDELDFATEAERNAPHERTASRVKYTAEMLAQDAPYARGFVSTLMKHDAIKQERGEPRLSANEIAAILHDFITRLSTVMDRIDDESLDRNGRMKVHVSRLTSARGQTDQKRFAERRQQDPVLRHIDADEAHLHGLPDYRTIAISQLVDLRASVDWDDEASNAWFERTYKKLAHEPSDDTVIT